MIWIFIQNIYCQTQFKP